MYYCAHCLGQNLSWVKFILSVYFYKSIKVILQKEKDTVMFFGFNKTAM